MELLISGCEYGGSGQTHPSGKLTEHSQVGTGNKLVIKSMSVRRGREAVG